MKRPDARWGHAARVALAATAVVGAVTLVLALAVNAVLISRLDRDVDSRVAAVLAAATAAPAGPVATGGGAANGDVDDAPVFVWKVGPRGAITALTVGSPPLPAGPWAAGTASRSTQGRAFRFTAVPSGGGMLVAGESAAKVGEAGDDLVLVELVLGTLLLLVTFTGSFVVGLRASAPIEQVRRRQAEFTADASHELRTPLSVIEAEVELALGRPRDPLEYEEALRRIGSESGRLRAIVEDLLWLARADAPDPHRGHPEVVDLSATVAATAAAASPPWPTPGPSPCPPTRRRRARRGCGPTRRDSTGWSPSCSTTPASTPGPGVPSPSPWPPWGDGWC